MTRRSLFGAIAGIPLVAKAVEAAVTAPAPPPIQPSSISTSIVSFDNLYWYLDLTFEMPKDAAGATIRLFSEDCNYTLGNVWPEDVHGGRKIHFGPFELPAPGRPEYYRVVIGTLSSPYTASTPIETHAIMVTHERAIAVKGTMQITDSSGKIRTIPFC